MFSLSCQHALAGQSYSLLAACSTIEYKIFHESKPFEMLIIRKHAGRFLAAANTYWKCV
jgi:hypothetical protein